jgi:retron-type reverse transcriptase
VKLRSPTLDAQVRMSKIVHLVVTSQFVAAKELVDESMRHGPPPPRDLAHLLFVPPSALKRVLAARQAAHAAHAAQVARGEPAPTATQAGGLPRIPAPDDSAGVDHTTAECAAALFFARPEDVAAVLLAHPETIAPAFLPAASIERAAAANPAYERALAAMPCRPFIQAMARHGSGRELARWAVAHVTPHLIDLAVRDRDSRAWWIAAWGSMRNAMLDHHRDGWLSEAINRHGVAPFVHPVRMGSAGHEANLDARRIIDLAAELGAIGTPGSLPLDEGLLEGLVGNIRARRGPHIQRLRAVANETAIHTLLRSATDEEISRLCTESIFLAYEEAMTRQLWVEVLPLGLRAATAGIVGKRFQAAANSDPTLVDRTVAMIRSASTGTIHSLPPAVAELAVRMRRLQLTGALAGLRLQARQRRKGRQLDQAYTVSEVPKRDGSMRQLLVPNAWLAAIQSALLTEVLDPMDHLLHDAAHGFRPGRSTSTNAQPHVGSSCIVNVDIADFFGSLRMHHVMQALSPLIEQGWSTDTVVLIAEACTTRGGLPTGAPTSPAIANHALREFDGMVTAACAEHGLRYTRYADDLTISAPGWSSIDPLVVLPRVRELVQGLGFQLAEHKTRVYGRGSQQLVTGLVTNDKVSVPKRIRRWLRAVQHAMARGRQPHAHGTELTQDQVRGWMSHLASIVSHRSRSNP